MNNDTMTISVFIGEINSNIKIERVAGLDPLD